MKNDISEKEFRQALQIDDRFEWPDGDFEFWIVWDSVRFLVKDRLGDARVRACEISGKIGDDTTDLAWRRGLVLMEERSLQEGMPIQPEKRRLAYRIRQSPK